MGRTRVQVEIDIFRLLRDSDEPSDHEPTSRDNRTGRRSTGERGCRMELKNTQQRGHVSWQTNSPSRSPYLNRTESFLRNRDFADELLGLHTGRTCFAGFRGFGWVGECPTENVPILRNRDTSYLVTSGRGGSTVTTV